MNNKLYIGNLDYSIQSSELKEAFAKWEVSDCAIIEGKGFGFLTFADAESANQAKEEMNNQELRGRQMKIDFAQERSKSGGGRRNDFKKRY